MPSSSRKRARLSPSDEQCFENDKEFDEEEGLLEGTPVEEETINDTLAALELLRHQFPEAAQVPPIILRSQVYDILQDWTLVDRQLEQERQKGSIRMIKLPASVDDYAYLLTGDYIACIQTASEGQKAKGIPDRNLMIFDWFRERVLPRCKEASISHAELMKTLSSDAEQEKNGMKVTDQQFALLMTTGLLTRDVSRQSSYLFAVAGAGKIVTSITKGRKEFLAALSRKRYKEVFLKDALKWKIRGSCLDSRWHIRDLLGRGSLSQKKTTSGPLLRLVVKK